MKRLLRWLLRPLVRWLSDDVKYEFGEYEDGGMFYGVIDGFGLRWEMEVTTDDFRDRAWKMIRMADAAEEGVESHQW